jgi:hypothetical protein
MRIAKAPRLHWKPEMIEEVRTLSAQGLTDAEVGRRMDISRMAIVGIRARNNIPAAVLPTVERLAPDDLPEMVRTHTQAQLAKHYHAARITVRRWLTEANLAPVKRVYAKRDVGVTRPNRQRQHCYVASKAASKFILFARPAITPGRDDSEAGCAQLFLQRYGAVYRASIIDPNATGWIMYGRRVSEQELIAAAARKGFQPRAMAA